MRTLSRRCRVPCWSARSPHAVERLEEAREVRRRVSLLTGNRCPELDVRRSSAAVSSGLAASFVGYMHNACAFLAPCEPGAPASLVWRLTRFAFSESLIAKCCDLTKPQLMT